MTVILDTSVLLERVLGTEVGAIYDAVHAEHGVRLVRDQRVVRIHGSGGAVQAVETADGTRIDADLVVVGIGATPRTALAEAAGLAVDNGILVDDRLETSVPGIFAAGTWHPRSTRSSASGSAWSTGTTRGARAARPPATCSATTSRTNACRTSTPTSSS